MKSTFLILSAVLFCMIVACKSSQPGYGSSASAKTDTSTKINNPDPAIDLADHLRTVPGLSVSGQGRYAKVEVRGMTSFAAGTQPLFVVDGSQITGGLDEVYSLVSVADIRNIRVLKNPADIGVYGLRGSNGVIEINLK